MQNSFIRIGVMSVMQGNGMENIFSSDIVE